MAWSWSHTQDAYDAVRQQIFDKPRDWLEVVWSEWVAAYAKYPEYGIGFCAELNLRKYHTAMCRAKRKTNDELAEFIWEKTQEYATCSNGGWEAYCCPFDCGCHEVPFTPEEEEET